MSSSSRTAVSSIRTQGPVGHRGRWWVLILAIALFPPALSQRSADGRAVAQGDPAMRLDRINQIGGSAFAIDAAEDRIYLGLGSRLLSVEAASEGRPRVQGRSESLPGVVLDLVYARDHVYALYANGHVQSDLHGLAIINVADATRPQVVARLEGEVRFSRIAYRDGHVLMSGNTWSDRFLSNPPIDLLQIVDVRTPARPVRVSRMTFSEPGVAAIGPEPTEVLVAGSRAIFVKRLLASSSSSIRVLDISDPAQPMALTETVVRGEVAAADFDLQQQVLYLVTEDRFVQGNAIHRLQLRSDGRFQSEHVESIALAPSCAGGIEVSASKLYYVDRCAQQMLTYDLASEGLREIDRLGIGVPGSDILLQDGRLFLAGGEAGGMRVIDPDPVMPRRFLADLWTLGAAESVLRAGDRIYTSHGRHGLQHLHVPDAASVPDAQASHLPLAAASQPLLYGDHLLVAGGIPSALQVYALDSGTEPRFVTELSIPTGLSRLQAAGDRVYAGSTRDGIYRLDLRDPSQPVIAAHRDESYWLAAAEPDRLYAHGSFKLMALDPDSMETLGEYSGRHLERAVAMTASAGQVYMAVAGSPLFSPNFHIRSFDALDPSAIDVAVEDMSGFGTSVGSLQVEDDRLLISADRGLSIAATPLDPSVPMLAQWRSPGFSQAAVLERDEGRMPPVGQLVYVADGGGGLALLRLLPSSAPRPSPTNSPMPQPTRDPTPSPRPTPTFEPAQSLYLPLLQRYERIKPDGLGMRFLGQVGGEQWAFAADASRIVLGEGEQIVVLDPNQEPVALARMAVLGRSLPLGGAPTAIALRDQRAYVLTRARDLVTLDLSEPTRPTILSSQPLPGLCTDIVIVGDLAFVAGLDRGLLQYDLRDVVPQRRAQTVSLPGSVGRLSTAGALLVVQGYSDASDYQALVEIGASNELQLLSTIEDAGYSAVGDSRRLYTIDWGFGIRAFDISRPEEPREIGWQGRDEDPIIEPAEDGLLALALQDDLLIAAGWSIHAIDLSDASAPRRIGSTPALLRYRDLRISGDRLLAFGQYVPFQSLLEADLNSAAIGGGAIVEYEIAPDSAPRERKAHYSPFSIRGMSPLDSDGRLFYALGAAPPEEALERPFDPPAPMIARDSPLLIDATGSSLPRVIAFVPALAGLDRFHAESGLGCGVSFDARERLRCFDLQDPTRPVELPEIELPEDAAVFDILMLDGVALLAAHMDDAFSIRSVDLRQTGAARLLPDAGLRFDNFVRLKRAGNRVLAIPSNSVTLRIFDAQQPDRLVEEASLELDWYASAVASDRWLFANVTQAIEVYDLEVSPPRMVSRTEVPDLYPLYSDIALHDDRIYVVLGYERPYVGILDVQDDGRVLSVGRQRLPGQASAFDEARLSLLPTPHQLLLHASFDDGFSGGLLLAFVPDR